MEYILLGAPEIFTHPRIIIKIFKEKPIKLLTKILNQNVAKMVQVVKWESNILNSLTEEIKRKFSDIFSSEINLSKLCTIKNTL